MLRIIAFTLFFLLSACSLMRHGEETPPLEAAPPGFSWYTAKNGVGDYLVPTGWFVKEESGASTNALFISEQDLEKQNEFSVGFTVNQINAWSKKSKLKPSEYAKVFIQKLKREKTVLNSGVVKGNLVEMNVAVVKMDNHGVPVTMHQIAMGLDTKDQVYLISFESPSESWKGNFAYGRQMLNLFRITK